MLERRLEPLLEELPEDFPEEPLDLGAELPEFPDGLETEPPELPDGLETEPPEPRRELLGGELERPLDPTLFPGDSRFLSGFVVRRGESARGEDAGSRAGSGV